MSITEYQRHQLFTWFEEHMDKERATTMMNLVPPVGWGDVATARDLELRLANHRAETQLGLAELRADIQRDVHELRAEMQQEFKAVRQEISLVRDDISALGRTFAGWLFLSQAAVIGAVAALVALV